MAFKDYPVSPSQVITIGGNNVAEGCPARNINNAIRQLASDGRGLSDVFDGGFSQMLAAFVADQAVSLYATRLALYADLAPGDKALGIVYFDTPDKNGAYIKSGAGGTGSWNTTGLMLQGQRGADGLSFYEVGLQSGYIPGGTTELEFIQKVTGDIVNAAIDRAEAAASAAVQASQLLTDKRYTAYRYLGPVSTGCAMPDGVFKSNNIKGFNTSRYLTATEDLKSPQFLFCNWYVNNNPGNMTEQWNAARPVRLTASVVDKLGNKTRIRFNNGADFLILGPGDSVYSDATPLLAAILEGEGYRVKCHWQSTDGTDAVIPGTFWIAGDSGNPFNEGVELDIPGDVDWTMTNDNPTQGPFRPWTVGPQAVLQMTNRRTFALLGDSIYQGVGASRALSPYCLTGLPSSALRQYGQINMGYGNDRATYYLTSHAKRLPIALHCSDIVLGHGANDFFSTETADHLENMQSIAALFEHQQKYITTVGPVSILSNNGYADLAGQSPNNPTVSARRIAYNNLLRAGVPGIARVWDTADVLESSRDSDKWKPANALPGGLLLNNDVTHPNTRGEIAVANSGVVVVTPYNPS